MTLIYRTTNPDAWGAGKGSNLTPDQVDQNFWGLQQAIDAITTKDGVGVQSAFVNSGNQLYFDLTDGTTIGPVTLPTVTLNPRGDWQAGTVYAVNDLVTSNGSVYLVKYAHTSAVQFDAGANDGGGHGYYGVLISVPSNALPVGGVTGQVLSKSSNANFITGWVTPHYVAGSGTQGQVLGKLSDNSYDYGWIDVFTVPAGGVAGQVLAKTTNTDFDYNWTSNGLIPAGGTDGQFLKKIGSADYSTQWSNISIPLVSVTVAASTSYTTIDPTAGDIFIISPISSDTTISVTGYVIKPIWLVFVGGSTSRTITFSGTSFRSQGTLSVTGNSMLYTAAFIPYSGSYKYLEVLRTTAV